MMADDASPHPCTSVLFAPTVTGFFCSKPNIGEGSVEDAADGRTVGGGGG